LLRQRRPPALMGLVGEHIKDRKVMRLGQRIPASRRGRGARWIRGNPDWHAPRGHHLPLLANIYLSVLDRQFARTWNLEMCPAWRRQCRRRSGRPNYRLVRHADDFVALVHGTRAGGAESRDSPAAGDTLEMTLSAERPTSLTSTPALFPRLPHPGKTRGGPSCRAHHPLNTRWRR
jgi:RNA-directed DNA polymerase